MFPVFLLVLLPAASSILATSYPHPIPLVGLFDDNDKEEEQVFRVAVRKWSSAINSPSPVILQPKIEHFYHHDSFNTSKHICSMADEGIGGVFGPDWSATGGVVRSICDSLHLPHLEMHWAPSHLHDYHPFTINLYPEPKLLAKALVAVIEDMDWTSFTLIYENTDSLVRMQELLKAHDSQLISEDRVPFTVWQLGEGPDYRPLLKEIQMTSETRIVLDCSVDKILAVLHQAKQVKLMGEYHSYILTSLDAHTLDLGELKSGGTNITMLSLIDRNKYTVQSAIYDLNNPARSSIELDNKKLNLSATTIKTGSALIYDAVQLYSKAVSEMVGDSVRVAPLPCHTPGYYWKHGYSIVSRMKRSTIEGMTGKVELDEKGRRSFFTIVITELSENGQRKIGSWDPLSGITYTRTKSQMDREIYQSISNKTFIVTSRLGKPYLWTKGDNYSGNDRFEGYSIDLIDEISKDLGFKYKFVLVSDGQYGTYNKKTKQWNGLIRELRERRADLAICDLTITYDRRSAVDFTMPFMTLGISILYSKPVKTSPGLFSFLSPLSLDVWMYMATAFLGVSLVLYIGCRISPYEWENPHPCNLDSDHLECVFSLHNCLWFSIGSLTGAGCDLLPKTISTRLLAGVWWFFALIMVSSYTANLAAFLTMERMEDTIENVEDLAKQNKIKYGVLLGGSSLDFFRDSNVSTYQKMWSVMESTRPTVFVKNNDEGVERVLKGKRAYAFFMESTSIEYQVEKHCELTQVGGLLDSKGYGIAMPFNSPYRTAISGSVLKMQESGKLHELKNKWWKEKSGKTCESSKHVPLATNELGMSNVGGVFLVLIIGCTLAFLVAILEFLWQVRKVAVQEKISPKEALLLELSFALQFSESLKPVHWVKQEGSIESYLQMNAFHHFSLDGNEE